MCLVRKCSAMPSLKPSLEGRHDHKHHQGEIFIYMGSGGWEILLGSSTCGKTLERLEAQAVLNGEVPTWWVSTSSRCGKSDFIPNLGLAGKGLSWCWSLVHQLSAVSARRAGRSLALSSLLAHPFCSLGHILPWYVSFPASYGAYCSACPCCAV